MVICHIITGFSFGGAEKLLVNFANIHAQKHNIHIVFLKGEPILEPLLNTNIKLHYFPFDYSSILKIRYLIKDIGAQVVHTHLGHADFLGFLAVIGLKCKLFCTMHNIWFKFNYKDYLIFFAYWFCFKTIAKRARVICISKIVKKHVEQRLGVDKKKTFLIYNCIPLSNSKISKEVARYQLNISKNKFCALFVGRLEKQKSVHTLLEAITLLPKLILSEALFIIVGEGNLEHDLKQRAKDLKIKNYIRFEGTTFSPEKYFSAADLFLLPSVFEGLGIVILEAFREGLPIIASAIEGPKELIVHKENGLLFEAGNAHDLSLKLQLLYNDSELREMISKNAKESFRDNYTISKYSQTLEELYEEK